MKINNLPSNYTNYEWIVCREFDGEMWYFGVWHDNAQAQAQAIEFEGIVINSKLINN